MQTMPTILTEELKNFIDNTIFSYEARLQSIESILGPIHQTQRSLLETKQEQEKANTQLRESLSKNNHLRKKDFDQMMKSVFLTQDEKGEVAKGLLVNYLNEQKEMVYALKDNLAKVRECLNNGQGDKIKEFQSVIKEKFSQVERRKEEVTAKLKELQEEQAKMLIQVKALLAKGNELRIKDFKEMLMEFRMQHKERIVQKLERKKEVRNMLVDFRKRRKQWRRARVTLSTPKDANDNVSRRGVNINIEEAREENTEGTK